jgi:hypothetical protein
VQQAAMQQAALQQAVLLQQQQQLQAAGGRGPATPQLFPFSEALAAAGSQRLAAVPVCQSSMCQAVPSHCWGCTLQWPQDCGLGIALQGFLCVTRLLGIVCHCLCSAYPTVIIACWYCLACCIMQAGLAARCMLGGIATHTQLCTSGQAGHLDL